MAKTIDIIFYSCVYILLDLWEHFFLACMFIMYVIILATPFRKMISFLMHPWFMLPFVAALHRMSSSSV